MTESKVKGVLYILVCFVGTVEETHSIWMHIGTEIKNKSIGQDLYINKGGLR